METKTLTSSETKPEPKILTSAIKQSNGKRLFELHFRKGNRKPESKVFELEGDLPAAITRARRHCEDMGYRFCGCYPFLVDLDMQEVSRNDEIHENMLER